MNAASKAEFRDLSAQHIQTLDMRAGIVMNVTPEDRRSACSSLKRASLVTRAIQQTRGVHRMRKHYSLEARDHRPDKLSNGGWTKWCIAPVVREPGLIGFECPTVRVRDERAPAAEGRALVRRARRSLDAGKPEGAFRRFHSRPNCCGRNTADFHIRLMAMRLQPLPPERVCLAGRD